MNAILLDTHVLVWTVNQPSRLGSRSQRLIEKAQEQSGLNVSAISFWEMAMLFQNDKLRLKSTPQRWRAGVLGLGFREVPLDGTIAVRAAGLLDFHQDPADRFIAATAAELDATLITADETLLEWRSKIRRQDARR